MMWDNGDGRWDRIHDGGAGWFMVLLMIVLVVAVVVAAVAILRGMVQAPTAHAAHAVPTARGADPRAILQERLARGEIDEDDFRARMRALDEAGPASG